MTINNYNNNKIFNQAIIKMKNFWMIDMENLNSAVKVKIQMKEENNLVISVKIIVFVMVVIFLCILKKM